MPCFSKTVCFILLLLLRLSGLYAQKAWLSLEVYSEGKGLAGAEIHLGRKTVQSDSNGRAVLHITAPGGELLCKAESHKTYRMQIHAKAGDSIRLRIDLEMLRETFREFVLSGTLKPVRRSDSPVPVEVYLPSFFKKNPSPSLFEALQNINGVRPQLNCNVCNTGDIHINGLEGPYTMVLIDGMPIVSNLSTVYGLSGIPSSLMERLEIVKGPASSLYGSEAVGGLINVITKRPERAPLFAADAFASSWGEYNTDVSASLRAGKKAWVLSSMNLFHYGIPTDKNEDGFTDITQQERISLFQKWSITRPAGRQFQLAGRWLYEDRWGGDVRWTPAFRGGDSLYAESIYTQRGELFGIYDLPTREKLKLSFSLNRHRQNSYYGTMPFMADQRSGFVQLSWDKKTARHDFLAGSSLRYIRYDDNSTATALYDSSGRYGPAGETILPGLFMQDEIKIGKQHTLLAGYRYDHHSVHGHIHTPRLAWKWKADPMNTLRLNMGSGYRVVNVFTEDHAALTGARNVILSEQLLPERSYNINLNLLSRLLLRKKNMLGIDLSLFYTRFSNRIIADYESDPNAILYDNLRGYAISRGLSCNLDYMPGKFFKFLAGFTWMDVFSNENGVKTRQILTEKFSGTWSISASLPQSKLSLDYTGNVYSPMRLPLLGPSDPRRPYSPWYSIQNLQLNYNANKKIRIYTGIKNLLNWTPGRGNPFLIARSRDPFDKKVQYDGNGRILQTPENPYGLSFDPNYVYGPNQGRRYFLGIACTID